ncbi:MAG: hypothetical protein P1V36_09555 [Planctomycetota bacterium]|nr:hypothetical protein [Planctomycetota bacterium]
MTALLAAGLLDVLGSVVGVILCLTGCALGFLGISAAVEGTPKRGLAAVVVGVALLAGGLYLTGFLP